MAEAPAVTPELDPNAAADADAPEIKYDVKIEDAGPAKKRLTITIPADAVADRIDSSYTTLASEAVLPGFRRGRAPRKLIERRFGSSVMSETRNQLVADAYSRAIEDNKIRTVGDPEADELKDLKVEPGKPLSFTVEVEVAPEFDLPELEGVKIRKPVVEVTDEHIADELKRQLYRHGEVDETEDAVQPGDRLQGRAVVTKVSDNEVVSDMPDAVVAIPLEDAGGKGHVLGLFVENMNDLFGGKKKGDTVTLESEVSDSDDRVSLRGEKVRVDFTINRVVRVTPAAAESVIEMYGLESIDKLKEEIRRALEQRAAQEQRSAMREQVCDNLITSIDFELPEKLSASQARRQIDRLRIEMLYRGLSVDEAESRVAEMRTASEEEAQNRLKLFFILHRLAEKFEIEVSDAEVNGRIAMIAAQRGERPERLRAQMAQEGRLSQIALQVREHKTLDRILDAAEIEEISAEEWNRQVQDRQGSGAEEGGKKKSGSKKKKTSSKKSAG